MPESVDVVDTLMRRMKRARAEAARTVARSEAVVMARQLITDPSSMVKRCAWCGRLLLGRRWLPADEVPGFVGGLLDDRTTHGICEACVRRLERDGASRPLKR